MDALIYTARSGAERALNAQQVHANNLANLETGGFRANLTSDTSHVVPGYGFDDRHMSVLSSSTLSSREGSVADTGRDLDVAVTGPGYLAVQTAGGGEAYTRAGAMTLDADGALLLNGRAVLGDGGPITVPLYSKLEIGRDGTISVQAPGSTTMQPVDKLKLVNPAPGSVTKNEAGLIVSRGGGTLDADATVRVKGAALEGSNVSAVEEMVATMSLNRDFEIQMKLLKAADSMADTGNQLIRG